MLGPDPPASTTMSTHQHTTTKNVTCAGEQAQRVWQEQARSMKSSHMNFKHKSIGGYVLGDTLGTGSCAVVKLGVHSSTGKKVAVKIVKPTTLKEQKEVLREVEALQLLKQHPHIIRLMRVIRENGYTCMILELGSGGDLFEHILRNGKMQESEARYIFRQLLSAVQYCHAHLITHRDLKPENVLIDASGNIKLSDFGLSNVLKPGRLCATFCGSPVYCPPEIVLRQQYGGTAADTWSLGVMLYVMVTGGMPWRLEKNVVKNMSDLLSANFVLPDHLSADCKMLIKMMLTVDSCSRATLDAVASHPWVSAGYDAPPNIYLQPRPLIEKKDINENILSELGVLGYDIGQARYDIQSLPTSPALTTYHLLLEKIKRASALVNVSIDENVLEQTQPPRTRSTTAPLTPIGTTRYTSDENNDPKNETSNTSKPRRKYLRISRSQSALQPPTPKKSKSKKRLSTTAPIPPLEKGKSGLFSGFKEVLKKFKRART